MINRIFSFVYSLFDKNDHLVSKGLNVNRIIQLENKYRTLLKNNEIISIKRRAMFWAQLTHESNLIPCSENMNYSASRLLAIFPKYFNPISALQYARKPEMIGNRVYSNRMGNGDERSGDGYKYRGHGLIQDTGKNRYIELTNILGIDFLNTPDNLLIEANAMLSALQFWTKNNINYYSDLQDIAKVTRIITGGSNGLFEREKLYFEIYKLLLENKL